MRKLTALLFVLTCAMAFAFTGCSDGGTFTEKTYASGESTIEKITVDVSDRELEVSASDDGQVHIEYFDSEKEFLSISVSENNELVVKLEFDKDWTDFIGTKPAAEYRKIAIKVPDNLIAAFSANTTNENIRVNSLSFTENANLGSNGGDVVLGRVNVGKSISLTAKNGDIQGSVIGGWDDFSITCKIKKGNSNLPESKEGGAKSLSADCNNGDINIEFVK